jgi:DNA repair protein RecN (Recombination protein N)
MLQFLNITNIALIDELRVEFDDGLNLLTGETGSGKSIIVDALGVLIGGRFSSDLLKSGSERGAIEGLFSLPPNAKLRETLSTAGFIDDNDGSEPIELIIRREVSATGRNKILINNQLATQSLLRDVREFLVDIHGQGEQQTLFDSNTHLQLLDAFARTQELRTKVTIAFQQWRSLSRELIELERNDAERFQLVDTLNFQIEELERAQLNLGEDELLQEERGRLMNVEKLTALALESYRLIYEDDDAALARLRQTSQRLEVLTSYESRFREHLEGLESARATLEELAFSLREFSDKLEFSPARLAEIDDRLAELSRVKRKYGGSIESALDHLARSQDRLNQIEHSDERARELRKDLESARSSYLELVFKLHSERLRAAKKFEKVVEQEMATVALANARFQVQIDAPTAAELETDISGDAFSALGIDRVEFYFSANVGQEVRPLAHIASGGEASRLMLVLKTVANASEFPRTIVFDEIDTGIGGRVSEAVGAKLKKLADTNQVLCVTHQAQIARFADHHLAVEKQAGKGSTRVEITRLGYKGRIEELARMLTGAEITDTARRHAKEMLKS